MGGGRRTLGPKLVHGLEGSSLAKEKLENMRDVGAECIVTPCAFCHLQFDRGQVDIRNQSGVDFNIPVLHYVQFLGHALGLEPEKLGLYKNAIPVDPVLNKL